MSQKQFYSTKLDINEISCRTAKSAENLLSNDENHFKIEQKMAFLRHCKHFGITFKILNREIAKPHINLTTKFLLFEKANDRKNAPMRTREKLSKSRAKIYSRKKNFALTPVIKFLAGFVEAKADAHTSNEGCAYT